MTDAQILRLRDVVEMTRISRSRIYVLMQSETERFPKPIRLGSRSVGWWRSEVEAWLNARERAGSAGS